MDANALVDFATLLAIAGGGVFGVLQLQQAARQRQTQMMADFVATFQQSDIRRAYPRVLALPDDAPPDLVRGDERLREAVEALHLIFEGHGLLVRRGLLTPAEYDQFLGGAVRTCWRKLRVFVADERARSGNPRYAEWWEWLLVTMDDAARRARAAGAPAAAGAAPDAAA